jgi:hypothetical protein
MPVLVANGCDTGDHLQPSHSVAPSRQTDSLIVERVLTGMIGGEADLLIITVLMGTHPGIRRCRRERWPAKGNHMPAILLGEEDRFDNNEMRRLYNSAEFPLAWRAAV